VNRKAPVIALAGRRVDGSGPNQPRFPQSEVPAVTEQIRRYLSQQKTGALVCSAACGSDLLALSLAGEMGIRRRVVIPFDPARFRATSVADRGDSWGEIYDRVLASLVREDLVLLGLEEGEEAYAQTNAEILNHARQLAGTDDDVRAVVIWDGVSRGDSDFTAQFAQLARGRGIPVDEISTMPAPAT
jgi:hypothetical protein